MGVIASRVRRHRRQRLAAELACTWTPRRMFPLGQEQGGVYYPDNPDALLRRVNLLSSTAALSTQSITATPRQQTLSFNGTGTVTLSGASTAGPLVGTGAGNRVTLTFTPTAASLTLTVTGTVTEAQLELGPAFTTYQPVTTWTTDYMAAVGHLVTQFQDSAGTTPVTKVTDPVGLTLDRRFGLYRGPQLMGAASGNNGWTPSGTGGTKAVSGSTGSLFAIVNLTANRMHEMIVVVSAISGTITPQLGNVPSTNITTPGTHYRYITPTAGTICYLDAPAATTATVASVSIRELPGNHRIQATSGSRKTLSARVNLLTKTEQFDDAAWSKLTAGTGTAAVVTANAGTDPLGGSTADRVVFARGAGTTTGDYSLLSATATGIVSGASYSGALWMKSNTGATQTVSLYLAASSSTIVNQAVGTTWTRVPVTLTAGATSMSVVFGTRGGAGYTSDQNLDILVWGADLRTADDAAKTIPAYQRVNTASDYDTDGFPHFWLYDGTDDSDATASTVDGSASDKVTVIAGIAKLSDAAAACVIEHTATSASNDGSFILSAPTSAAVYQWRSKGTALSDAATASSYPAPHSGVLTGVGDIANDTSALRIGGAQVATAATDQGTGTYANATTYFGRRGASLLPFNGREYAIIERFGPMSDSERNQAERWVAQRMGVTI